MKLTAKLVICLVIGITLLLGLDGYFAFQRELELLRRNKELNTHILRQWARQMWRSRDGYRLVLDQIKDVNEQPEAHRLRWVWLDAPRGDPNAPAVEGEMLRLAKQGRIVAIRDLDEQGNRRLRTCFRVTLASERPGGIEVIEPWPHPVIRLRAYLYRMATITGLIAILGGFLVYVLGTEMVGRPLDRLIEKTRRAGQGDLTGPLQLKGRDELTELAGALNSMCDQLSESNERIRQEEAARTAALNQLRHSDRLRTVGGMASGLAHELGTPLSVVAGRASLIASEKLSPNEITQSAGVITEESERMATIIRQLLDFARRSAPQKNRVDFRHLVRQTIELLHSLSSKQGVTVHLTGDDQPMMALMDAGQIQQVLTNLIVNAIQSLSNGGSVEVSLDWKWTQPPESNDAAQREYLRIDVRDEGAGIADENLDHLFEPFFTTKDIGEGTGLGLSISYGIVQEHSGWIEVTSELGKGSCFSVYLPQESDA